MSRRRPQIPLVHLSNGSWATVCRPGRDAGPRTETTTNAARVTCPACVRVVQRRAAAQATR